jgi:tetratricopeptide (TPR) repeat protein
MGVRAAAADAAVAVATDATVPLNSAWLRNRVAELGLKQWWLAEQLGVDKKTVIRWLHGHVRALQPANARALAGVLGCRVADLTLPRDTVDLASAQDQRTAAALLATSTLIDKLGPVGEWDVIESLLKAVALPDLPLHVLGTLYNRLCEACWRQDKLDEAEAVNRAALQVAERCGDQGLRAGALLSQANLRYWRGDAVAAIAGYRECLALKPFLAPRTLGAIHSNLGGALYETGDWEAGEAEVRAALAQFRFDGTPTNRSVAHSHLAMLALLRGDDARAEFHNDAARTHAQQGDYRRGLALAQRVQAEIAALRGEAALALQSLADMRTAFETLGIREAPNLEAEARVLRLLGRVDAAEQVLIEALPLAADYPLEAASLQRELARVRAAMPPRVPALPTRD